MTRHDAQRSATRRPRPAPLRELAELAGATRVAPAVVLALLLTLVSMLRAEQPA